MSNGNSMSIIIRGQKWSVVLLTPEDFAEGDREGAAAVTDTRKKSIIFNTEDLDLNTVIHEMVHAYYSASCTMSANITPEQTEELMAEMLGEFGVELIKTSRKVLKELKALSKEMG